tara:strand:- start:4747 stop:4944 length:198 start_codon:yes stop_codon:yes gene_type:complete
MKTISNFWLFIIASIVFVATALLLQDHEHCGTVLIFEGVLSGARGAGEILKTYQVGKTNPERLRV